MKKGLTWSRGASLQEIATKFDTEEKARAYLETVRWPKGPVCPHCGNRKAKPIWNIKAHQDRGIRKGLRQCAACGKQFTVTVGTIFADSHIPLKTWLLAWFLLCRPGVECSSLRLQKELGLGSYRTALLMARKIRSAFISSPFLEDR